MSALRRPVRPLTFVSALLLTTAIAAPAFAQIEQIVVTAQKRTQNAQSVPIAMTALSAKDLAAHQITQFQDLQFSTPDVTYTKGNFTGSDFQIRGIGVSSVGYDAESGVAINMDNVYLATPLLAESTFYDLQRIEVLRGPQSTLYGRGATGGVVNVISSKADPSAFYGHLQASYGNYDATELKGFLNVPIVTDKLALRIAGDWTRHGGYTTNVLNHSHIDNQDVYSLRSSLRWTPTSRTTIDLVGQITNENDNRMRSQKQLCHTDPTGVLGCLPDYLTNQPVNLNSNLSTITSSIQGLNAAFAGTPLAGIGNALGLFDLASAPVLPAGYVDPAGARQVSAPFNPLYRAQDMFLSGQWKQSWSSWLDSTLVLGTDHNSVWSQESYNNIPGLPLNQARLATAEQTFLGIISNPLFGGSPTYASFYTPFFSHPGMLPTSGVGNLGITGGNIAGYSPNVFAFDQSDGAASQYSAELRFNTHFSGPVNGMLAGYYLHTHTTGDYYVNANTLDYPGIILGGLSGLANPACQVSGCIYGPSYYHSNGMSDTLTSKAIFGEVYYTAIPDLLKFTAGLRWTQDVKAQQVRVALYSGLIPIGTTSENSAIDELASAGKVDYDPLRPGSQPVEIQNQTYSKWTGRFVVNYTPKLNFTDATLLYASYARGYKAGGFNPGIPAGVFGVQASYKPESIDAYELGTKNTALDGHLQANADIWYYNYTGLQVSKIVDNTSVNENINSQLYGVEGQFIWAPTSAWQFNLNLSQTNTSIGNTGIVDPRNPTNGFQNALLVKDATPSATGGSNCVLYYNGATPGSLPNIGGLFFAPAGGVGGLASQGIPYATFGSCMNPNTLVAPGVTYGQALAAQGFATSDPSVHGTYEGVPTNLKGNRLQNTPSFTLSVGGQYTMPLKNDYRLVSRVDYYWQTSMYGTVFNDPADRIPAWGQMDAQVQLNSPDDTWYVRGFVKNLLDANNMTGMYVTSPSSGLYTNVFYGAPRTFGIAIGTNF